MTTVVTGATLIDGTGADPITGASVVIEDGRIAAVGSIDALPGDADVIDVGGATVMPGMIDSPAHPTGPPTPFQPRPLPPPTHNRRARAATARATLEAGFTLVRDAGGTPVGFKLAAERGLIAAPRMRLAIVALSQTGGHGDGTMPSGGRLGGDRGPEWPEHICDGPDEVRKTVRTVLRAGADFIKLHATGGVLSPSDEPGSPQFTQEEIAIMVYEARMHGKTCMSHAQATEGIKNALHAGVESIEHGFYLDDEAIAIMKAQDSFLVPTLHAPRSVVLNAEASPESVLPQSLRKAHEVIEANARSFRAAHEAGVKVAMGTDCGVGTHGTNAWELELMVEHGMTPMEAIVATTKTAAECCHVDTDIGTLEPGKLGDLIVVDGDPLADVTVLQQRERICMVMQGGEIAVDRIGG
ncbi:MAG: amidohydrolase family protein [Chloroflexi bacterium]|nr:amidohydrolase family protein [Chloroflexota bacterium]